MYKKIILIVRVSLIIHLSKLKTWFVVVNKVFVTQNLPRTGECLIATKTLYGITPIS